MCGILGVIGDRPVDSTALLKACETLAHRGPDGAGTWKSADGRVALAHRRLTVVDLTDGGRQPLANEDGSLRITYNGEIYNHGELRRELVALGHRFRSTSDTEVVVHAYQEWGAACVAKLRGMFAFGVWDDRRQCLFLARDRLGVKPLYYYVDAAARTFVFASELSAIEALPRVNLAIDETALYDFLSYLYVPAPKTPYRHVRKLPPAHTLTLQVAGDAVFARPAITRYWDVHFDVERARSQPDAVAEVREALADAIGVHLIADVEVGSLLSGGLDSSVVTMLAARELPYPIRTFFVAFEGDSRPDAQFAAAVATAVGSKHTVCTLSLAQARARCRNLLGVFGEPFADTSAIPTMAVSERARRNVKVVLSGDGGDELFGGYSWYGRHLARARFASVPLAVRRRLPAWLETSAATRLRGVPRLVDGLRPDLERHTVIMGGLSQAQKLRVLPADVARSFDGYDDEWYFRQHWRPDLAPMARWQYLDLMTYLPDDILVKVDRASMAFGLEVRPPLLDHRLVELVAGLPAEVRNPEGRPKHLLRLAADGLVPAELLDRPKQGFSLPSAWQRDIHAMPAASGRVASSPADAEARLLPLLGEWTAGKTDWPASPNLA